MGVLGTLGAIPFICSDGMVNTFNKFSSSYGESYAEYKVMGGAPALEWTGSNSREFSLDMRLDFRYLGSWDCKSKRFYYTIIGTDLFDEDFLNFRSIYNCGNDFVVTSGVYVFEDFKEESFIYE